MVQARPSNAKTPPPQGNVLRGNFPMVAIFAMITSRRRAQIRRLDVTTANLQPRHHSRAHQ